MTRPVRAVRSAQENRAQNRKPRTRQGHSDTDEVTGEVAGDRRDSAPTLGDRRAGRPVSTGAVTVGDDESQEAGVERLLLTPEQAAEALAIGRTTLYRLLSSGALPSVHIGGSRRIAYQSIRSFVDELPANPSPSSDQPPPSNPGPLTPIEPEAPAAIFPPPRHPRSSHAAPRRRRHRARLTEPDRRSPGRNRWSYWSNHWSNAGAFAHVRHRPPFGVIPAQGLQVVLWRTALNRLEVHDAHPLVAMDIIDLARRTAVGMAAIFAGASSAPCAPARGEAAQNPSQRQPAPAPHATFTLTEARWPRRRLRPLPW
jgi:excisionase family DNA binding protein